MPPKRSTSNKHVPIWRQDGVVPAVLALVGILLAAYLAKIWPQRPPTTPITPTQVVGIISHATPIELNGGGWAVHSVFFPTLSDKPPGLQRCEIPPQLKEYFDAYVTGKGGELEADIKANCSPISQAKEMNGQWGVQCVITYVSCTQTEVDGANLLIRKLALRLEVAFSQEGAVSQVEAVAWKPINK